jgi:N-acetylmuramoyl-L-alanine amidase
MRRFFLFLLLSLFATNLFALNTLTDAQIVKEQLVLTFNQSSESQEARTLVLKQKHSVRYVFDFPKTIIRKRSLAKKLTYGSVTSFRISQFNSSTVRLVIETREPFAIAHRRSSTHTYTISLPKGEPRDKKKSKRKKSTTLMDLFDSIGTSGKKQIAKMKAHPKKIQHRKSPKLSKSYVKRPKKRYTIVVDPGHGGRDSGALGGSRQYMEKTAVLQIAKRVRSHLKRLGFRVYMTRDSNRFVKLGVRTRYANRKHADAFVSIHANAVAGARKRTAEGIETYFLQVSRSARSKRVAARENSVVLQAKDRVSKNVLLNLMTGPKIVMSNKMAIDVQKGMLKNLRSKFRSVKDNGVRPAPFWVLVGAQMPAVLGETGYITHPEERKRLFSTTYQEGIAKGIAEGISNYFANREREME